MNQRLVYLKSEVVVLIEISQKVNGDMAMTFSIEQKEHLFIAALCRDPVDIFRGVTFGQFDLVR